MSFQARFLLPVSIIVALTIVGSALFIAFKAASREDIAAQDDAQRQIKATQTMLAVTEALMVERVKGSMRLLKERAVTLGTPTLAATTTQVGEKSVPMLLLGGRSQIGNFELVDSVTATLGGTATLFVKSGNEFVRVSTNVKKADGSRAIGTILDPKGKAITAIREKQAFYGVVDILGNPFITGYEPMLNSAGELVGIWYVGYKAELQAVKEKIEAQRVLTSGYLAVTDGNDKVRFRSGHVDDATVEKHLKDQPKDWRIISEAIPGWGFKAIIAYPQSEAQAASRSTALQILIFGLVLTGVLLAIIATLLKRMVLTPLGGDPAAALSAVRRISDGNLRDDGEAAAPSGSLLSALVDMRHALREMVGSIDASAIRLAGSAAMLVDTTEQVASAALQQTDATANIAATLEEITVSIRQVSDSAEAANDMAKTSGELSAEGQSTVGQIMVDMRSTADNVNSAAEMVQQLGESSRAITGIVNVIKEIADQTNLLALNAAIEAARAGEQGRGFAVVADEVRKLAERTTQSTQEITLMIDEIQQRTGNVMNVMGGSVEHVNTSVGSIRSAGESMTHIRDSTMGVLAAFNKISAALREQSQASEQISRSIEAVANRNDENSMAVNQLADSAHKLNDVAADLRQAVARFKV